MSITIVPWLDLSDRERRHGELDAIFFEASGTKKFATDEVRRAFRERWLGRYLDQDPASAYIALDSAGDQIVGYIVGSLDDPARTPRFADIGYFATLAEATRRFPAHLHVNLAPKARGAGVGSRLLTRFAAHAATAGATGVHVVTGKAMRNVSFYLANGFREEVSFPWGGKELVLLGRRLG